MKNILTSVSIHAETKETEKLYAQYITKQVVLNNKGEEVTGDVAAFDIDLKKEIDKAKTARVGIDNARTIIEVNDHVIMGAIAVVFCLLEIIKLTQIGSGSVALPNSETSSHAQMNYENMSICHFHQQIFCTPTD